MPEFNRWSRNRRASILAIFPEIWTERKKTWCRRGFEKYSQKLQIDGRWIQYDTQLTSMPILG